MIVLAFIRFGLSRSLSLLGREDCWWVMSAEQYERTFMQARMLGANK